MVKDKDDRDLFLIEKFLVRDGQLGQEEIEEFKDEIVGCKPTSATQWLLDYFDKVKVIYAFQILNAVDNDESWTIVGELREELCLRGTARRMKNPINGGLERDFVLPFVRMLTADEHHQLRIARHRILDDEAEQRHIRNRPTESCVGGCSRLISNHKCPRRYFAWRWMNEPVVENVSFQPVVEISDGITSKSFYRNVDNVLFENLLVLCRNFPRYRPSSRTSVLLKIVPLHGV